MFSKSTRKERIDPQQQELYEYARARVQQKKWLMRHFIALLAGSLLLIIINPVLGVGNDFFIKNWFVWAILIWAFLFFIHVLNVFIMNRFMGKKWERDQLEKLRARQEKKLVKLQQRVEKEIPLPETPTTSSPASSDSTEPKPASEEKKSDGHAISPENQMITLIAAAGENNELGKNNDLVWRLPDDFKRFKQLTSGHHIIMGRKTFESLPGLLSNRVHVVVSRNPDYKAAGVQMVSSLEEALRVAKQDPQPFIIGGGEIYRLGIEVANKIELTRVHGSFEADTFFPKIPLTDWKLKTSEFHDKDDHHAFAFTYETWVRK